MKKKEVVLYFSLGAFVYGAAIYILHSLQQSLIWFLFFLLLSSLLVTLRVSDANRSFGKQFAGVCVGLFFFGWFAVIIIVLVKAFALYVYRSLS
ncbi:hypothetical protein [Paenibacillus sp. BC26]|uniref:hypothetical protein n=1 Tax=Paenibacillus sp. BC26 TaxID=1881032 RepID=UPI0008E57020|nr:hypothetical protein [Paenibacillus sp. BC26]SFT09540.1 hypothetical protein SAMN05428962_4346 [Paenibacillus sp. BC26]